MSRRLLALLVLVLALPLYAAEPFAPDPASVRRHDAGYRYPQNGWAVVHIEGEPYDRGFQHGKLLSKEIETYRNALAEHRAPKHPAEYWDLYRELVGGMYLHRFDREYLEEMKGIADGAVAGGAKADGRPLDVIDVAGINLWVELACLGDALRATPTGLEDVKSKLPVPKPTPPEQEHHCSAFAATGPATADGKIVFGHITMWNVHQAAHFFVWLDVKPAKGHRVVMQTFPGGIYSGMDYYLSSSGLMMTETTIEQTRFNRDGTPLATRARKALQYANTIDELVKELVDKNNGLYTNEWLIGDAHTNEIAVLEQGTNAYRLRRSSQNQWLVPGVEGFYWGCNNAKDVQVRLDTIADVRDRPQDVSWKPSDRDLAWLSLYKTHRGKIDADFGKRAYSSAPLAKLRSLDAKVTTTALAKELKAHAVQGPPYGRVWQPEPGQKEKYKILRPLVPNDWTVLTPAPPGPAAKAVAVDLGGKLPAVTSLPTTTTAAWHGTLLSQSDADVWLTAAFAKYERFVAAENAKADRRELDLLLFRYRTDFNSARLARPASAESPLDRELDRARWHKEETARGVLTLHALRGFLGAEPFAKALDGFGRANAGKEVSAKQFLAAVGESSGKDVAQWLADRGELTVGGPAFTTASWLEDPERAVIVYGTAGDAAANREAAAALQTAVRTNGSNAIVPVKADADATDAELKGHVILIGRPAVNRIAKRFAAAFPVEFGYSSAVIAGKTYAHDGTAVVTVGTNPLSARHSLVLVAGLSADATYRCAERASFPAAEVVVQTADGAARRMVVTKEENGSKP
jgi:hypothetical protein